MKSLFFFVSFSLALVVDGAAAAACPCIRYVSVSLQLTRMFMLIRGLDCCPRKFCLNRRDYFDVEEFHFLLFYFTILKILIENKSDLMQLGYGLKQIFLHYGSQTMLDPGTRSIQDPDRGTFTSFPLQGEPLRHGEQNSIGNNTKLAQLYGGKKCYFKTCLTIL